jgi:hypothetical protein
VNIEASFIPLFKRAALICSSCAIFGITTSPAYAQSNQSSAANQSRSKIIVQTTKQVGLKDKSGDFNPKTNSMRLNPGLFQRKSPDELILDADANLDYRVIQGCLQRSFSEDSLPASIGINNPKFAEFFKNQTKSFFDIMRGSCIPYAAAFGSRNRMGLFKIAKLKFGRLPHQLLVDF